MLSRFSLSRILMIAVLALAVGRVTLAAQQAPAPESSKPAGSNTPAQAPPEPQKGQAVGNITRETLVPKIIEPWNTPSLEGSDLEPSVPEILGEVNTIDGAYTHEIERVMWRPADPIDLYIIRPVGVKNPPVV